jgi:hypothetical protein
MGNLLFAVVGITAQLAIFLLVALVGAHRRGVAQAVAFGAIASVFGYALVIAFFALLGLPWQVTNVFALGVLALIASLSPTRKMLTEAFPLALAAASRSWVAITVVGVIVVFNVAITTVMAELSIDGQLYHGPALALLVQSGSLWGWTAPNEYVYYTDLTIAGGVNLAAIGGDARFDNGLQIPHLVALISIVSWALSRRFTSAFARVAIAALIVSAPVIWLQPRILYVDLAYGAAVVAVIIIIALVREFRTLDLVVAGIAVSAVFATKPTGILTGMILLFALVVAVLLRRRAGQSRRATMLALSATFIPSLIMGTSFYVRNFVQFSNPVFPIEVKLGPLLLPGIVDLSIFATGERGSGFVDPSRWISYARSLGDGMLNGVSKLDYDPRAGGFGYMPLLVLIIAAALLAIQVALRIRSAETRGWIPVNAGAQVILVILSAAILMVQPSTFDTRYVIGPTVALLIAIVLTDVFPIPSRVQVLVGVLALCMTAVQAAWVERSMYPGFKTAVDILQGPAEWQPNTPAHPGPQGLQVAWLPSDCVTIALQTSGGVTPAGMNEASWLATFPYGLYGDKLCNRVLPVTLDDEFDDTGALYGSDFLVLYASDTAAWLRSNPDLAVCLVVASRIDGTQTFPQASTVYRNSCS